MASPERNQHVPAMTTLVLLPGMDGTGLLFEPFLRALPPELSVQVVSYPGHDVLTYEDLESFVLDALPFEGRLVLLGESFSGPLAVSLAARLAGRVSGLVLCCTFVQNPRPAFAVLKPLARLISPQVLPLGFTARLLLGPYATPGLRTLLRNALAQVSPAVLRARLEAVVVVKASAALASVKVPVVYLQATQDALVPARAAQLALKACPAMRVMPIRGPHCLLQAAPAETAAVVAALVREIESAS